MKAIEILVEEHDSILKMIEITSSILNKEDETTLNIGDVEKIIDFVKNFADKYHHLKEEDVLFQEMENYGMPREGGPIGVMLHEHDEGRNYIRLAVEGIEKLKQGDKAAVSQIKDNLRGYCSLLTNHIAKENNILYPMAEQFLPENVMEAMSAQFEKTNSSTADNEYYDKYLKMVDELSVKYL